LLKQPSRSVNLCYHCHLEQEQERHSPLIYYNDELLKVTHFLLVFFDTIKTRSEFRNVSVMVTEGVVDGLAVHGLALHTGCGCRAGTGQKADLNWKL